MKKLMLALEELEVDSFTTSGGAEAAGTVAGHEAAATRGPSCQLRTACCPETFQVTCAQTCTC